MDAVYFDHAATTPLDARVAARMRDVQAESFANPSSNHALGRQAAHIVRTAEAQLRELLQVTAGRVVWTSGATEANNLAILGTAEQRQHRGRHLVTMRSEHKAVVDAFRHLEKNGFEVTWLAGDADGALQASDLAAVLRDDTQLVSIMHVNNETGLIQDIAALGALCRDHKIPFHVDGAQAAGKIAVNLDSLPVDLYAVSAHKFYGPKGVGALLLRDGVPLQPQLFGGGQQRRLRPGTLPTDLIAGLGEAAAIAARQLDSDLGAAQQHRARLLDSLLAIDGVYLNGPRDGGYPGIVNIGADGVEGESLLLALEPLCVATGSACNAHSQEPSYVLRSLGRNDQQAQSAIRFSIGRGISSQDVDFAIEKYRTAINKLRELAP